MKNQLAVAALLLANNRHMGSPEQIERCTQDARDLCLCCHEDPDAPLALQTADTQIEKVMVLPTVDPAPDIQPKPKQQHPRNGRIDRLGGRDLHLKPAVANELWNVKRQGRIAELAKRSGVKPQSIYNLVNPRRTRKYVRSELFTMIAKGLGWTDHRINLYVNKNQAHGIRKGRPSKTQGKQLQFDR